MKKLFAFVLAAEVVVVLTLLVVEALAAASLRISEINSAGLRLLAELGAFGTGVVWLLAIVYLATRMAVLIFGNYTPPQT